MFETGQWTWVNDYGRELVFIPKGAKILGPSTHGLSQLSAAPDYPHGHTGATSGVEGDPMGDGDNESSNGEA